MASKNTKEDKSTRRFDLLDTISRKLVFGIDKNLEDLEDTNLKNRKFQDIINREYEVSAGYSKGNIIDFVLNMKEKAIRNDQKIQTGNTLAQTAENDLEDIFKKNASSFYHIFQESYKNRYMEIQDLKMINKFIPALGEGVNTILNSITSSDIATDVMRVIFVMTEAFTESEKDMIERELSLIEKRRHKKLRSKLKNSIIKNTLIAGDNYVYCVPYKKLFEDYLTSLEKAKVEGINKVNTGRPTTMRNPEVTTEATLSDLTATLEHAVDFRSSITGILENALGDSLIKRGNIRSGEEDSKIKMDDVMECMSDIYTIDSQIPFTVLESVKNTLGSKNFFDNITPEDMNTPNRYAETTFGKVSNNGDGKITKHKFDDVNGVYMKVLDFKRVVPVKLFDEVVGYYYLHVDKKKVEARRVTTLNPSNLYSNLRYNKKGNMIEELVDTISQQVANNFSYSLVKENSEFKKVLADCIIHNGVMDNVYRIQFIPASDIINFKINEDDDGNGQSVLANSLFPAKLLLSLMVCKIINFLNNSGDKTIAHVYKGPIGVHSVNQVERVIRNMQESTINFVDVLSSNLMFSKIARNNRITLPTSKNNQKLVEWETIDGQQIDLNTDYENKLEKMAIMGMGLPETLMEYLGQVEFAKQIETSNMKYAQYISSLQADLEVPTTEMYLAMLMHSTLPDTIKDKLVNNFSVSFPRPKVQNNSTTSDLYETMKSLAKNVADNITGEPNEEEETKRNAALAKKILIDMTPFINWPQYESMHEEVRIELKEEEAKNFVPTDENTDMSGGAGGGDDAGGMGMDEGGDMGDEF